MFDTPALNQADFTYMLPNVKSKAAELNFNDLENQGESFLDTQPLCSNTQI